MIRSQGAENAYGCAAGLLDDLASDRCLAVCLASGALTSALGYALWCSLVPGLRAFSAATVQLSVTVIGAIGEAILLDEQITLRLRLVLAATVVLGGIALVLVERRRVGLA